MSNELTISWDPALRAFTQFCIHRGLYLQTKKSLGKNSENSDEINSDSLPLCSAGGEDSLAAIIPEPWQDRLTKLLNRKGIEAVLKSWAELPIQYRSNSCVSMFALHGYSQLISSHGAMSTEQALRATGEYLRQALSNHSLVSRYQSDRFVVLHFSESLAECHQAMEDIQAHITKEGFVNINDEAVPLGASVSIVELEEGIDLDTQIETLDEGNMIAEENGSAVMSKYQGEWESDAPDMPVQKRQPKPAPKIDESEISRVESGPPVSVDAPDAEEDSVEATTTEEEVSDTEEESEDLFDDISASHDISAVASAADIEALFAQIHSKKSQATTPTAPSTPSDSASENQATEMEPAAEPPPSGIPADDEAVSTITSAADTDAASADDIAALFAAAKNQTPATTTPTKSPSETANQPIAVDSSVGFTEHASKDDIAALFAAAKGTNAPTASSPHSSSSSQEPKAPANVSLEDMNEAASADDIAALFAAASKNPATLDSPVTAKTETRPSPETLVSEAIGSTEAASADDIAALFAAAKSQSVPTTQTTTIAPKTEPTVSIDEIDKNEAATADDIAELFATVQSAMKPSQTDQNSETASAPSHPTPPPAVVPTGESLQEAASSDDIEALFVAFKK